jgi:hypothetical protein
MVQVVVRRRGRRRRLAVGNGRRRSVRRRARRLRLLREHRAQVAAHDARTDALLGPARLLQRLQRFEPLLVGARVGWLDHLPAQFVGGRVRGGDGVALGRQQVEPAVGRIGPLLRQLVELRRRLLQLCGLTQTAGDRDLIAQGLLRVAAEQREGREADDRESGRGENQPAAAARRRRNVATRARRSDRRRRLRGDGHGGRRCRHDAAEHEVAAAELDAIADVQVGAVDGLAVDLQRRERFEAHAAVDHRAARVHGNGAACAQHEVGARAAADGRRAVAERVLEGPAVVEDLQREHASERNREG